VNEIAVHVVLDDADLTVPDIAAAMELPEEVIAP
jgi:hypothetical protein